MKALNNSQNFPPNYKVSEQFVLQVSRTYSLYSFPSCVIFAEQVNTENYSLIVSFGKKSEKEIFSMPLLFILPRFFYNESLFQ